jgi:hypothetical protein
MTYHSEQQPSLSLLTICTGLPTRSTGSQGLQTSFESRPLGTIYRTAHPFRMASANCTNLSSRLCSDNQATDALYMPDFPLSSVLYVLTSSSGDSIDLKYHSTHQ